MKRNILLVGLLLAIGLPLMAAGTSYRQELSIGKHDHIRISTDVPDIIIEHNNSNNRVIVSLEGPDNTKFRMFSNEGRDGIVVEVKRKNKLGFDIIDMFGTELRISLPKNLSFGEVEISSVSGSIQIETSLVADEISFESVSGAITFVDMQASEEVEIESVSGRISGAEIETTDFSAGSVSGSIDLKTVRAPAGEIDIETVSGSIVVGLVDSFEIGLATISGKIDISLSPSFGGKVETSTISGRIETKFPAATPASTDKRITTYRLGSEDHEAIFTSTSGAIHIAQ